MVSLRSSSQDTLEPAAHGGEVAVPVGGETPSQSPHARLLGSSKGPILRGLRLIPPSVRTTVLLASIAIAAVITLVLLSQETRGTAAWLWPSKPGGVPHVTVAWHEIEKLPPPAANASTEYWVVTTTINPPTEAIRLLVAMEGWQLVVVGDTKTPKDWHLEGAIYLGVEDQKKLGYRIHDLIPYRSYARKNIGYLYAIQHGARTVYETDDDNILLVKDVRLGFDVGLADAASGKLLAYQPLENRTVVNPYIHFGQPTMWPRGYPLDAVAVNGAEAAYDVAAPDGAPGRPLIQQGLANGDPDVDAIYRLTRATKGRLIRVAFDENAPPVAIPPRTFCPFNSQNTLFHRDALWGMMIPVTTAFRVCDIWRGYWAQRLVHDIGGVLSFYGPSVRQDRNIHDYFLDYLDEKALYMSARDLVSLLLTWRSDEAAFFDRVLALSRAMAAGGFWGHKDVELTAAWLSDLIAVGYEPPPLRPAAADGGTVLETRTFVPKALETSTLAAGGRRR